MKNQIRKLAIMLGIGGLAGPIPIAAATGLWRMENAFLLAILFMAGPGAIITATLIEGNIKQRMFVALAAGAIATIIVMISAGFGPRLLEFTNLNILKIAGGTGVLLIGLLIMGLKIPEKIPFVVIIIGLIASVLIKS